MLPALGGRDSGIGCENEPKEEEEGKKIEDEEGKTEVKKAEEREERDVGILFALLFTGTFILVKFFNGLIYGFTLF